MENLKTLSVSELHLQIKNATDELIAREIEKVDKPTNVEQFKTEKRNAHVGETIVVTNPREGSAGVVGEIFTVTHANSGCVDVEEIKVISHDWAFYPTEYEVLAEQSPVIELQDSPPAPPKTNNQQRSEINQRAREFVERKIESLKDSSQLSGGYEFKKQENPNYCSFVTKVKFAVNPEKRTVVALLSYAGDKSVLSKGIAICAPGDVFNEWIGKAIALARALEIDFPQEFLNAVQPDEAEIGMLVHPTSGTTGEHIHDTPKKVVGLKSYEGKKCPKYVGFYRDSWASQFKIIDDTNAIYEEELE